MKRLPRKFYRRPVLDVARACVGKLLVHETDVGVVAGRIVEVEAYRGPEDRAAHSFGGRRTRRTEVMFGLAGHAYVFFLYGMHWNFNVVTGEENEPCAVLIRGIEPLEGVEIMAARRAIPAERRELTNGPAKLCQAFDINGGHSGLDLCHNRRSEIRGGSLFLAEGPAPKRIATSPRVGIDYAGAWAKRPWRFFEPENRYVSGPLRATLHQR